MMTIIEHPESYSVMVGSEAVPLDTLLKAGIVLRHHRDIPPLPLKEIRHAAAQAVAEVQRQDQLARAGKFGDRGHILVGGPDAGRMGILAEEFGEIAREVNEDLMEGGDRAHLREELIQLAACCLSWAAAISVERQSKFPT